MPSVTSNAPNALAFGCGSLSGISAIANVALPLHAYPCAPGVAFATVSNAGFFAGLVPHHLQTHGHVTPPGTCEVADGIDAESSQDTMLGCSLLPSVGSAAHHKGLCKPCAFGESCRNGAECEFCHICKPLMKSKRGRWILKRRKAAQELQTDMLDLKHSLGGNSTKQHTSVA